MILASLVLWLIFYSSTQAQDKVFIPKNGIVIFERHEEITDEKALDESIPVYIKDMVESLRKYTPITRI